MTTWEEFQASYRMDREQEDLMVKNLNCDGVRCTRAKGEVRLLPMGGRGGSVLCRSCYAHEIKFRRDMNRDRPALYQYELPGWNSLKICERR